MTASTAVEKTQAGQKGLLVLLEETKPQLARLLDDPDRLARILTTEARRTPKLLQCTPESFLAASLQTAQLRLEPGPLEHVYFIPRKNKHNRNRLEVQLYIGYRGYIELADKAGITITAATVHERDEFDYQLGVNPTLTHRPALSDRGDVVASYAVAQPKDGSGVPIISVLTHEEILERKRQSESGRNDKGPWKTHFPQMARKSAVRALWPQLPTSTPEMQRAYTADEQTLSRAAIAPLARRDRGQLAGGDVIDVQAEDDHQDTQEGDRASTRQDAEGDTASNGDGADGQDVGRSSGESGPHTQEEPPVPQGEEGAPQPAPTSKGDRPASDAQVKAIHTLAEKAGLIVGDDDNAYRVELDARYAVPSSKDLTVQQAGNFIDALQQMVDGAGGES
jgi:recombination protein RecT